MRATPGSDKRAMRPAVTPGVAAVVKTGSPFARAHFSSIVTPWIVPWNLKGTS